MTYNENDVNLMALCAYREARGEGLFGCFLVLQVIFNRIGMPGFGATVHDVIMGRNQFSSMSIATDPDFSVMPPAGDSLMSAILQDVPNILAGTNDDPTHGALYYANEATETSGWYYNNIISSPAHPILLTYGHHIFRA